MDKYTVCAFYKFINIPNHEYLKEPINNFLNKNKIMGTILIAHEGINGTISGRENAIIDLLNFLKKELKLQYIDYKLSFHNENPFYRTKVRLKKEIVTMGEPSIDPKQSTGTYIEPELWNELIEDKDTILIDTRNEYEIDIGTFENSINPHTKSFRDFPTFADKKLNPKKHKKIAMFCTGGIRCEKSTAYLKQKGFDQVYHLKGGILNYLKKIPKNKSKWIGECFVFDNRVSVDHDLKKGNFDQCHACRMPISAEDKDSQYYKKGISCPHCYKLTSEERKKRFKERQKQVELANKRGKLHIGNKNDL